MDKDEMLIASIVDSKDFMVKVPTADSYLFIIMNDRKSIFGNAKKMATNKRNFKLAN